MKKGETYRIKCPGNSIDGLLAKFVRESKVTGEITVELLEAKDDDGRPGWIVGDHVQVKKWELVKV